MVEKPGPEARGTVLSSQPEGGQQVPQGTPVELVVSAGPSELRMPDVVGRELFEVRATLEQLGLKIGGIAIRFDERIADWTRRVADRRQPDCAVTAGVLISIRVSGRP